MYFVTKLTSFKILYGASPVAQGLKILPAMQKTQETQAGSLGWEDTLE